MRVVKEVDFEVVLGLIKGVVGVAGETVEAGLPLLFGGGRDESISCEEQGGVGGGVGVWDAEFIF